MGNKHSTVGLINQSAVNKPIAILSHARIHGYRHTKLPAPLNGCCLLLRSKSLLLAVPSSLCGMDSPLCTFYRSPSHILGVTKTH